MKNILLTTILLASPLWCRAYTITNFSATTDTSWATNVVPKLNANNNNFVGWLNSIGTNLTALNSYTNWGGSTNSSGGITNFVLTATNLPAGSAATVTNTGTTGGIAYYTIGIPAGSNGVAGGTIYPSNTWNLAVITNGMMAGDIITVNSNGLKLVDVWMSNSTPVLKPHW